MITSSGSTVSTAPVRTAAPVSPTISPTVGGNVREVGISTNRGALSPNTLPSALPPGPVSENPCTLCGPPLNSYVDPGDLDRAAFMGDGSLPTSVYSYSKIAAEDREFETTNAIIRQKISMFRAFVCLLGTVGFVLGAVLLFLLPDGDRMTTTLLKTVVQFDCRNDVGRWDDGRAAWCCIHKQRGCPKEITQEPFDCSAGFKRREVGWSMAKKKWCCMNKRLGCDASPKPNTDAPVPHAPSPGPSE